MKKPFMSLTLILIALIIFAGGFFVGRGGRSRAEYPDAAAFVNDTPVLLVNAVNALPDSYEISELVNLYEQKRHFLIASSDIYLAREAFDAANLMFLQAENENMNGFIITSGYRTAEKQAELYAESEEGIAQLPGHSEHETGLAFDVTARSDDGIFENTPQFAWLVENCWDYGFILRYPEGKEHITGISYEPWHYRYVGVDIALAVRDSGLSLEEYLYTLSND